MKIIVAPNPILTTPALPVLEINHKIKSLGNRLINALANKGIGLAAPQIGYDQAVFVLSLPQEQPEIFINPTILDYSSPKQHFLLEENDHDSDHSLQPFLEGCLSLPNLYGAVKRWPIIKIQRFSLNGKKTKKVLTGLEAIVFQHELDHLNGRLFIQRVIREKGQLFCNEDNQLKKISPQKLGFPL